MSTSFMGQRLSKLLAIQSTYRYILVVLSSLPRRKRPPPPRYGIVEVLT